MAFFNLTFSFHTLLLRFLPESKLNLKWQIPYFQNDMGSRFWELVTYFKATGGCYGFKLTSDLIIQSKVSYSKAANREVVF